MLRANLVVFQYNMNFYLESIREILISKVHITFIRSMAKIIDWRIR